MALWASIWSEDKGPLDLSPGPATVTYLLQIPDINSITVECSKLVISSSWTKFDFLNVTSVGNHTPKIQN